MSQILHNFRSVALLSTLPSQICVFPGIRGQVVLATVPCLSQQWFPRNKAENVRSVDHLVVPILPDPHVTQEQHGNYTQPHKWYNGVVRIHDGILGVLCPNPKIVVEDGAHDGQTNGSTKRKRECKDTEL